VRKVLAYESLSLDGVAEHADKFVTDFGDANAGKPLPLNDLFDRADSAWP
jgi:hypothetical protein